MSNLAYIIKLYLTTEHISARQFSSDLGLDKTTMSRFLNGHTELNLQHYRVILEWLHTTHVPKEKS